MKIIVNRILLGEAANLLARVINTKNAMPILGDVLFDVKDNEVTLALTGKGTHKPEGYGYDIDHSEEYRAIGKKVYDWLTEVAVVEHSDHLITTGAELDITATLNGRRRDV